MGRISLATGAFALAAVALIAAYLLVPPGLPGEWIATGAMVSAGAIVVVAAVARRPVRPVPWALLGVGLAIGGAAHAAWAMRAASGTAEFPGALQAVGILAYPSLFVGMASITSRTRDARDPLGGSEPLIYAVSLTALAWVAVTGSYIDDRTVPLSPTVWLWLVPLLDVSLALLALRGIRDRTGTRLVMALIAVGCAVSGVTHGIAGLMAERGVMSPGHVVIAASLLGPFLLGLAVTLPSMSAMMASDGVRFRLHWAQVVGLLIATLVPVGVLIAALWVDRVTTVNKLMVAVAAALVVILAIVRIWRLVNQLRRLTEQRAQERLDAIVEHSSDVALIAGVDGIVSYASPGLEDTLGVLPHTWVGRHLLDVIASGDRNAAVGHLARLMDYGNGSTVEFDAHLTRSDGELRRMTIVMANLVADSAVSGIVATFRDVTDQRNLEKQLSHRAFHDELSGLPNRALFLDRMDHAVQVSRPDAHPIVVLFVDLDDFKAINDRYGHAGGDEVLRVVGERIRRSAGSGDTVARLGGDEFGVLLEDRGGVDRAIDLAEAMLDSLRDPVATAGGDVTVLASIGVAVAAPHMSTTALMREADVAMYEAKRSGKGQIRLFDPAMRIEVTKHLEYRSELADALDREEFGLSFEPIVDLGTGEFVGAEALLHWNHPVHGMLPSDDFMSIAERSGLIVRLGRWAMDAALRELRSWPDGFGYFMTIALTAAEVRQPDFVNKTISAIDRHQVDSSALLLMISEPAFMKETERTAESVAMIRLEGVRVAIDEFGSAECSVTNLQRNTVDLLRLDAALLGGPIDETGSLELRRVIFDVARSLKLDTIAPSVQNPWELIEVRRSGGRYAQGPLIGAAVPPGAMALRLGQAEWVAQV